MKRHTCLFVGALFGLSLIILACNFGGGGGDEGPTGQPTAKWFIEKGPPSSSQGANGDLYLDKDAAVLYVKTSGQWVAAASLRGPAGSGWLFGAGAPASTLGSDGDLYLDTSTSMAYRKLGGAWSALFALKGETGAQGPAGTPGTQWYSGSANPTSTVPSGARAGDYYVKTSFPLEIFRRDSSGSWNSILPMNYVPPSFVFTPHMDSWGTVSFYSVAYGDGVYIAVGSYGTIVKSTDGRNWKLIESSYNYNYDPSMILKGLESNPNPENSIYDTLYDVVYGKNIFVTAGYNTIYYSEDKGDSWHASNLEYGDYSLRQITFLNNIFYATGYNDSGYAVLLSSSDGINWNVVHTEPDTNTSLIAPVCGQVDENPLYLMVLRNRSTNGFNRMYISWDGEFWIQPEYYEGLEGCRIERVTYGGGFFAAVGSINNRGTIWLSLDGSEWTSQDLPLSTSSVLNNIAYGCGFTVIGSDTYTTVNLILTSPNGISWNIQSIPQAGTFTGVCAASPPGTFAISVDEGE